jgi:hypothetical protein
MEKAVVLPANKIGNEISEALVIGESVPDRFDVCID